MDELEKEIGVSIQHVHYDKAAKTVSGEEHRPLQWRAETVDGYYENKDDRKTPFAFEFLGDHYHGHPRLWRDDPEAKSFFGDKRYKDLFEETEKKLQKLVDLGYWVIYIWESEYRNKTALMSLHDTCRRFDGRLLFK